MNYHLISTEYSLHDSMAHIQKENVHELLSHMGDVWSEISNLWILRSQKTTASITHYLRLNSTNSTAYLIVKITNEAYWNGNINQLYNGVEQLFMSESQGQQ